MTFFIQGLGLAASLCAIVSAQFRSRHNLMAFQLASGLLWAAHFFLLGAQTGAASAVVSLLRTGLFASEKAGARRRFWLWLFLALYCLLPFITWQGAASLLAGAANCFTTMALWCRDTRQTRRWLLADAPCWLLYDLCIGSWSGVLAETVALGSYLAAILRLDRGPRRNAQKEKE